MLISKDDVKQLSMSAAALIAGFVVKKTLEKGYKKVYRKDPPDKIEDEEPAWIELITWTLVTGIATSAIKNAIRRESIKKLDN